CRHRPLLRWRRHGETSRSGADMGESQVLVARRRLTALRLGTLRPPTRCHYRSETLGYAFSCFERIARKAAAMPEMCAVHLAAKKCHRSWSRRLPRVIKRRKKRPTPADP